ncbi:MAG: hypothetical protein HOW73_36890 [Polyangiaceae bacterium]|nr:hypothetical protein [Polyangiaceae bacterium]
MLTLSPAVRVFVVVAPLDMRGSFDALAGAVRRLGLEPTGGHLYLFLNKRRAYCKGAVVRRFGLVRACKAARERELPAARLRRGGIQGPDRWRDLRFAAGRDRLLGRPARLVPARHWSNGDRHGSPRMISSLGDRRRGRATAA